LSEQKIGFKTGNNLRLKKFTFLEASDPSMGRYLEDIRKTSPYSRKAEQELFRLYRKGDSKARATLISGNMRFVLKVALQYRGGPIAVSDLVSEGAMGLSRAIERFDHTRGLKFISYAVWWIRAYITKAINEESTLIRLPANQHLKIRQALKSKNKDTLNDEIRSLLKLAHRGPSFDAPLTEDSRATYAEVLVDEKAERADTRVEISSTAQFTRELLMEIPEREARVLRCLFGIGFEKSQNLREVGESMGISHERVRQLRDQALHRLRKCKFKDILREKLEAQIETAG
jgi:RNA polymerase primary sigma factor